MAVEERGGALISYGTNIDGYIKLFCIPARVAQLVSEVRLRLSKVKNSYYFRLSKVLKIHQKLPKYNLS